MSKLLPVKVNKGTGPAIVLLHGLGNNYKSWTYVLRALDYKKSQVIALDLLGFGDAPKPKNIDYTPHDHTDAVIKTLDRMKITGAVIAGHSMGCIVALQVAQQRPDLAKQLVLLGAPLYKSMPKRSFWNRIRRGEGMYFKIFQLLKDNPDITITGADSADKLRPLLKGMEITKQTWLPFKKSLNNTIMQFASYKDACKLKTPMLLVCGILDVFVISKNLKAIAKTNKNARYKLALGPHEITPLQGKRIAKLLQQQA